MQLPRGGRSRGLDRDARSVIGPHVGESPISFRALVEQSLSLILVTDRTGKIEYVNPRFCAVTGFDESELVGRLIHQLGDLDPATTIDLWNTLGFGQPWHGEFAASKKNGETFCVLAEVSPVSDDAGAVTHFVSVGQDITAEREALNALRSSEEKFRQLAEALPAFTFIVQGGRYCFVSSRAQEVLGYTTDEMMMMDFWDPVHPDFKELVRQRGIARQRGEVLSEQYEVKFVTKNGEERWSLVTVAPIEFRGAPAVVGCVFDITDTKNTTEALHERDLQLRLMTEQMPFVIWMTDRSLTVTDCAGSALRRLGVDVRDYIGQTIPPQYPLESGDTTLFDAHVTALSGASVSYELNFLGIWFESRIEPLYGPDGEIIGCLGLTIDITTRKEADRTLRESEENFRRLAETIPASVFIFDGASIVWANEAAGTITGYSPDELRRMDMRQAIHPDHLPRLAEAWQAVRRGETPRATIQIRRKDGSNRWADFSAALMRFNGRHVVLSAATDITESKQAEEALAESEEKFRTLVDTMPAAAVIFQGSKVRYANRMCYEVLGYSPEDIAGLNYWDAVHPDYRDLVRERGAARLRGEDVPNNYEVRFLKKNGEARWGLYSGAPTTYDGEPALLGVIYDITERKNAEGALTRSEERYRILYQDNPSMYFTLARDLTVLSVNKHGAGQLGYTTAELTGQPVLLVVHPGDQAHVRRQLRSVIKRRGSEHGIEFRKVRKDGDVMWVKESMRVTQDVDHTDIILVVCEDITARKRIEEEMQSLREDLERKAEQAIVSRVSPYNLSWRELTVLDLVTGGRSDKEIAVVLGIRPQTVSKHVANVLKKMSASSRTEAGVRALREGLIT